MNSQLGKSLLILVCLFFATAVQAEVIYRETFGRPDSPTTDMSLVFWDWADYSSNGHWVPNVTTNATDPTNIVANFGVNGTNSGRPTDVANVNAGPNSDGTFGAYARSVHYFLTAGGQPSLSWTPEYSLNPANYTGLAFSWYEGNANAADSQRLAVKVGSQWYVSAASFSSPATTLAQFTTNAQLNTVSYDPAAANWLTLDFNGGYDTATNVGTDSSVALAVGAAPGADLSGNITGYGILIQGAAGTRRFDTFQIDGTLAVSGLPGDYNGNNVVDTADYVVWREGFGTTYTHDDYTIWKTHFANTPASAASGAPVPEPASFTILLTAAGALIAWRRRTADE